MEKEQKCCLVQTIGGVTFYLNLHPAEKAKQTTEEFVKALIYKESLAIEAEQKQAF